MSRRPEEAATINSDHAVAIFSLLPTCTRTKCILSGQCELFQLMVMALCIVKFLFNNNLKERKYNYMVLLSKLKNKLAVYLFNNKRG